MYKFLLLFILMLLGGTFWFYSNKNSLSITTPLPRIFGTKSALVNNWIPKDSLAAFDNKLVLSAKSAIAIDYDTAEVLFEKNSKERRPIASTVKIVTALVALSNANPDTLYTVSKGASQIGENSMGLSEGEKLTLRELLYGLMLVSGNDAAVSIAEGVSGTESQFVEVMNVYAKNLDLEDTKFVNASGLDVDGELQYSSAWDLAIISRYAWDKYPLLREISSTINEYLEASGDHKAFDLYNDTNLLTTYPGVKGIKPGFTWEAGLCLVTYAENEGKRIIAVVLGSDDRRGDMKELLDYSFGKLGVVVSHPALD